MARHESIEDILIELRVVAPTNDIMVYLNSLADRIEAAHAAGIIAAMDELMSK